jgi:glutaconyl-CoA decarboxylase
MKKYNITVNGKTYEVEVDEAFGAPGVVPAAAPASAPAPASAAVPAPAAAPAQASSAAPSSDALAVESPMPGTIINVLKNPGDAVADGDVVLILEAMKMENEIVAPKAGVIDVIAVEKAAAVNSGDLLFSIK